MIKDIEPHTYIGAFRRVTHTYREYRETLDYSSGADGSLSRGAIIFTRRENTRLFTLCRPSGLQDLRILSLCGDKAKDSLADKDKLC